MVGETSMSPHTSINSQCRTCNNTIANTSKTRPVNIFRRADVRQIDVRPSRAIMGCLPVDWGAPNNSAIKFNGHAAAPRYNFIFDTSDCVRE